MITLHELGPAFTLRTASPFGLKLEAYMKLAGIPYRVAPFDGNPGKAPKGKIPYITDDDGRTLGDSALIIEHLVAKHGDKLDARLTPAERAMGHALRRMTEEGLYFAMLYSRWIDDAGFAAVGPVFFAAVPSLLRPAIGLLVRRNTRKTLQAQGTGRHTREEVYAMGRADLQALEDALGDKLFFLGNEPTSYDAAIYGIVHNLREIPTGTPLTTFARSLPKLAAFCARVTQRCFEEASGATP
jgi:glutathione S-transferase